MPEELTALELAERIGRAVHCAIDDGHETRAEAVLRVVKQSGHWFCKLRGEPLGNEPSDLLPFGEGA